MKAWRCDLTALSQSHNLYFVACCDTILVYQPEFPDQRLSEPKLVLQPPVSAPDLEPYIDPEDPHSITRLLVDYLGNDEILLATCDDGDVIGYRVGEIQRVLDLAQQTSDEGEEPDFAAHVRVFLHRNVGLSAWGLAIHREARIIAISANTHEITVLAFALAAGGDVPPEGSFLDTIMGSDFPSPRRRNHIFTLKAGQNIPSVSFNNSEEDSGGRWLFATCITGETTLWDLHNPGVPARVIRMGWCRSTSSPLVAPPPTSGGCQCVGATGYPHATWNATFLDPRSAHEVSPSDCEWTTGNDAPFFDDAEAQKERFRSEQSGLGHSTEHVATDEGALYHASDLTTSGHVSTNEEAMNLLEGASESSQSGNDYSSDSMWIDEGVDTGTSYPDHANPPDRHSDEDDDMEHEQEPQVSTAPTLPSIQDHLTDYADSVMGPPQPMQPAYMPYAVTGFPQFPISLDEIADLISGSMEYDSEVEDDGEFAYMPPQFHAHPHYENLAGLHVQPPAYREFKDDPSFTGFNVCLMPFPKRSYTNCTCTEPSALSHRFERRHIFAKEPLQQDRRPARIHARKAPSGRRRARPHTRDASSAIHAPMAAQSRVGRSTLLLHTDS